MKKPNKRERTRCELETSRGKFKPSVY
jgi:hypothetical protein